VILPPQEASVLLCMCERFEVSIPWFDSGSHSWKKILKQVQR